jgi:CHAD domain-containing protein
MLEEERKYDVDAKFTMPDLTACVPSGGRLIVKPPVTLRATYYDTADLSLARAGASLRHRRGDDEPWTVKLPTGTPGKRNEISMAGPSSTIPPRLLELVTPWVRGERMSPATVLSTVRQAYQLLGSDDEILVEVVDDLVSVQDGRKTKLKFREIEVERKQGKEKLLDKVEKVLCKAGARAGEFTPKHVRALGPSAQEPPDWPQAEPLGAFPGTREVITAALRKDIARIVAHDPLVRLRAGVGEDDTAVHQMRVGCRRLRSDLRTFGPALEGRWAEKLRDELSWVAESLGAARDAEVLRDRLRQTAAADALVPLDKPSLARIDAELAARHEEALTAVDEALRSERYQKLLESLVDAARQPRFSDEADVDPTILLPRLVGKPWRRLAFGRDDTPGAAALDPAGADDTWHAVRILGKRARYATEAVAGVLGGAAAELSLRLARVQELLGEHQDAAVAAETWLTIANSDPDDHALAVTAGRLYERERASIRAVRGDFAAVWRKATKQRIVEWLR